MPLNKKQPFVAFMQGRVQHYNPKRYWRYRTLVISTGGSKIIKYLRFILLYYIKRCDAFNNSSFGTDIGGGAQFKTPPRLPHGPNGIIVSPFAVIGANSYIYQQVTIGDDGKDCRNAPVIGDNVSIGAGAKVLGKIKIGNNVKIGAGAIVVDDVPDGATVVGPKARIIIK